MIEPFLVDVHDEYALAPVLCIVDLLGNSDYIMPASSSELVRKNYEAFCGDYEIGTSEFEDPMMAIKEGKKTALQFFNEFRTKYNQDSWKRLL